VSEHKEFSIFPIEAENGVCSGNIEGTIRLWPHKLVGEGHFAARLRKNKLAEANSSIRVTGEKRKELIRLFEQFKEQYLRVDLEGVFVTFGEELYLVPDEMRELKGIKVIRSGLHLGTYKKNRFEPAHSLAKALTKDEVKQFVTVQNPNSYLRGESFREDMIVPQDSTIDNNGWTLTCIGSYAMGWSKCTNGTYKNHYPKGLRLQY
jgi:NOL1/NOP2/fmu family ribosome biogenesis protein